MTRVALVLAVLIALGFALLMARRTPVAPEAPDPAPALAVKPAQPAAPTAPTAPATLTTPTTEVAPPAVVAPPSTLLDHLRELGKRTLVELSVPAPVVDHAAAEPTHEIPAFGACARPTADERAQIARAITAADHDAKDAPLAFGCKDPNGIIVDVAYDRKGRDDRLTGVWKIVRASSPAANAHVTTLVQYIGESQEYWMEWSNEVSVSTNLLVDLDGDGDHDAVIARNIHEGGARGSEVEVSLWVSRKRRMLLLGTIRDYFSVVSKPPHGAGAPLVIRSDRVNPDRGPSEYRCIEPIGKLDICPAIAEARHVDRAIEIANGFVNGTTYGPAKNAEPDRELLAELLGELRVAPAEQAALLAEAVPAEPEVRVARDVEKVVEKRVVRHFGEPDPQQPPDPRPAELMAVLGDAPCTPATREQRTAAIDRVSAWIADNDQRALVAHADCKDGAKCRWSHPSKPAVVASCVTGEHAYYSTHWTYLDKGELLAHDALFFLGGDTITLVADGIAIGSATSCAACGYGQPGPQILPRMYQRGAALIAVMLGDEATPDEATPKPRTLAIAINGALTKVPAPKGWISFYRFGESNAVEAPDAVDLIQVSENVDAVSYWRWDGGWKKLAGFVLPTPAAKPPVLDTAGAFLWHQKQRVAAREELQAFDLAAWELSADNRAQTARDLVIVGAPAAVRARVTAAANEIQPAP